MDWAVDGFLGREEAPASSSHTFLYDGVTAGRGVRAGLSRRSAATRPMPMEELCFFVKSIDNSRLVRVVDPHSRRECVGLVLCVLTVFVMAMMYAAPYLAKLRSGYRLEDLKKEHEALFENNRQLQVREAALKDPRRIHGIARGRLGLDTPTPGQVAWTEPRASRPSSSLLARNAATVSASSR